MFRSRSWFGGGGLWKPKNPHSLEHLKYLYNVLSKNQVVSETNRSLLVETLRSIAEILIWGDQNDSTVFDFFLEKNMLAYFLKIMRQKCGSYVCVQLLQTLNILFENIRNETSLYYLLSNNHVNSIIVHKFDFSDEEVMAYFISFLKTLSLKLNCHTIHFFYNEHTHDFPLYTEAIKFFNNSESMVRIAVRTLTLNVYRVREKSMLKFIRDRTAAPYFSNLVWFISNHVIELDSCIRNNSAEQESRIRLADLVAEHLDHLHYLNDILCLQIDDLNQVLTEHLIQRLFIPVYLMALENRLPGSVERNNTPTTGTPPPKVSRVLALFLLSQVFLITTHAPLVELLANLLINGNREIFLFQQPADLPPLPSTNELVIPGASTPTEPTEESSKMKTSVSLTSVVSNVSQASSSDFSADKLKSIEETYVLKHGSGLSDLTDRPILSSIYESLDCVENDYAALFTLCLLSALHANAGINPDLLNKFFYGESMENNVEVPGVSKYNEQLVDKLVAVICLAVKYESKIRVITLQLLSSLLLHTVMKDGESFLGDAHLASIEGAREENILLLQNYYKTDELFLEIFEDEYLEMTSAKSLSLEHLMMDSNLLLPPAGSPLTGIDFDKRLPCGEVERSRRSMRIYFLLRKLSLTLRKETEKYLPLTNTQNCVRLEESLDLTNSDMLSCTVITRDNVKTRRFLVVDTFQIILVDPSNKRMGWGVVKFVGFLQDIEILGDKDDSRCLHITVKTSPTHQRVVSSKTPVLQAKFMFDDHIRCIAAKQRLQKGRQKARQRKLHLIARLLDLTGSSPSPPQNPQRPNRRPLSRSDRQFNPISRALPGLAVAVGSESSVSGGNSINAVSYAGRRKSREASPSLVTRTGGVGANLEEEIPLGNIRQGSRGLRNAYLPSVRGGSSGFGFVHGAASSTGFSSSQNPRRLPANNANRLSLGLNSVPVHPSSTTTNDAISSPTDAPDSSEPVVTPQSETSFMTISAVPGSSPSTQGTQDSFRPPESHHSMNNQIDHSSSSSPSSGSVQQPSKKQKGAIETV